nr:hypothetical protein [Tanacetum cinerariifolium]
MLPVEEQPLPTVVSPTAESQDTSRSQSPRWNQRRMMEVMRNLRGT